MATRRGCRYGRVSPRERSTMSSVADVMSSRPVAVEADAPVGEAARLMAQHHVGLLPVMRGPVLLGVVTDRDLVLRVLAEGRDPAATTVLAVASESPVTVAPEAAPEVAERLIEERRVRRLPVVSTG